MTICRGYAHYEDHRLEKERQEERAVRVLPGGARRLLEFIPELPVLLSSVHNRSSFFVLP